MTKAKVYTFNWCLHWEKENRGRYVGINKIWNFESFLDLLIPFTMNDGNKGFFMWLFFRCGWYPTSNNRPEISSFSRKIIAEGK